MPQSPRDLAHQKIQLRKQQETLLRDLLTVVDALDRAAEHWHQAEANSQPSQSQEKTTPNRWQRWRQWLGQCPLIASSARPDQPDSEPGKTDVEVVASARQGIDMIRESMLAVLSQHQIIPLPSQGHPFDPTQMHALGQQVEANSPPNTVVQEVVRGYCWKDRVLREAQVIVAVPPAEESRKD